MHIAHFAPWPALAGGMLIGLAATLLWFGAGRVAGVSGIFGRLLEPAHAENTSNGTARQESVAFLVGLLAVGVLCNFVAPQVFGSPASGLGAAAIAGLFVGAGTRLGSGCTSGHGVCGISRGSWRSIAATCMFMATGFITVYVLRRLSGSAQ
jgi:uncharacterized protein